MRLPAKLNKISETFDGSDDNESDVSFDKTQDDFIQSSNFRVSLDHYFLIAVIINYLLKLKIIFDGRKFYQNWYKTILFFMTTYFL